MEQSATIERADLANSEDSAASASILSSLIQAARLEFLASVQLLVERARFITGANCVALAIKDHDQFVYCASCGTAAPPVHSSADLRNKTNQLCIQNGQATRSKISPEGKFTVAVPVVRLEDRSDERTDEVFGFFELTAGREFRDSDIDAISRLAELVTTALEHRRAAEDVESRLMHADIEPELAHSASNLLTDTDVPAQSEKPVAPAVPPALGIHGCKSCGFPVSSNRQICLDCEEKLPGASAVSKELFSTPATETWLGAHGYTIATLLVTAAAAAIIYWLR